MAGGTRDEGENRRWLWLTLAFVAAALLYLWGVAIPHSISLAPAGSAGFLYWDLENYFLPKFVLGSQQIQAGFLPVWNRFEFGGIPLLATAQPAALYPPKVLCFALFEPSTALRVFLILHFVLLAGLFVLFVRDRVGGLGLLVGTVFWTFNATVIASNSHPIRISNVVWVPLIFWLGERLIERRTSTLFAALAAVVGLQCLAGYPDFVLDTGLLIALHATMLFVCGHTRCAPWVSVPLLAAAFLLGACVGGIQMAPLIDLVLGVDRIGLATQQDIAPSIAYGLLTVGFPGLLAWVAAAGDRRSLPAIVSGVFCLAMCLGAWKILRWVPGFAAMRLPGGWLFLLPFALAWIAAEGADRLGGARGAVGWGARAPALAVAGIVAGFCVLFASQPDWGAGNPVLTSMISSAMGARAQSLGGSLWPLLGCALMIAFLLWPARGPRSRALALLSIAVLTFAQLRAYPFEWPHHRFAPPEIPLTTQRLLAAAPPADPPRSTGRVLNVFDVKGGYHIFDGVESLVGREGSLPPPRFRELVADLGIIVALARVDWRRLVDYRGVLASLDVRTIVAPMFVQHALGRAGYRLVPGSERAEVAVFEQRDPLGRAFAVYGAVRADDPKAALARVRQRSFDPRLSAIVEGALERRLPARAELPPTGAVAKELAPHVTEVSVEMRAPGMLVLAESCFDGWRAWEGDRELPIHCTNYYARGVELDRGHHVVRFEYDPASLRWGAGASAFGIVALIGLIAWPRLRASGKSGL